MNELNNTLPYSLADWQLCFASGGFELFFETFEPVFRNARKGSRMLVPANVGFQEENLAPEGLERVNSSRCAKGSF
jgi:hypothetical protein